MSGFLCKIRLSDYDKDSPFLDFAAMQYFRGQTQERSLSEPVRRTPNLKGHSVHPDVTQLQKVSVTPINQFEEADFKSLAPMQKKFQMITPQQALQAHSCSPKMVGIFLGATCQYITPAIQKHLGYNVEEWHGKSFLEFVHPKDQKQAAEFCEKYLSPTASIQNTPTCRVRLLHKEKDNPPINFELVFFDSTESFPSPDSASLKHFSRGVAFRNIDAEIAQKMRTRELGHELNNTLGIAKELFDIIDEQMQTLFIDPNQLNNEEVETPIVDPSLQPQDKEVEAPVIAPLLKVKLDSIQELFVLARAQVASASQRCRDEVRACDKPGELEVYTRPTNLYDELTTFAQINIVTLKESDIKFLSNIDVKLKNTIVVTDFKFLSTVFENFVKNSKRSVLSAKREIKFISLTAEICKESAESFEVGFALQDAGTGFGGKKFDKKTHAQIFSGKDSPAIIDNGLGLLRSVDKIKILGGELLITSDPNTGSTLEFILSIKKKIEVLLPLPLSLQLSSPSSTVQHLSSAPKVFKILIVEDQKINSTLLERNLGKYNTDYQTVVNGQLAIEACEKEKFDIILMDFEMPVLDGPKACAQIRATEGLNKETQIWGLTANCTDGSIKEGKEAGMNCVLTKPLPMVTMKEYCLEYFPGRPFEATSPLSPSPRPRNRLPTTPKNLPKT